MTGPNRPPARNRREKQGQSGREGDRTLNPRLAKPVLSQLSYAPKRTSELAFEILRDDRDGTGRPRNNFRFSLPPHPALSHEGRGGKGEVISRPFLNRFPLRRRHPLTSGEQPQQQHRQAVADQEQSPGGRQPRIRLSKSRADQAPPCPVPTSQYRLHRNLVGAPRFELGTSSLSGTRSNQLSYAPVEQRFVF